MNRTTKLFSVSLTTLACTLAGLVLPGVASAAPKECASVSVFGLRGSGQTSDQNDGFGPEVSAVVDELTSRLSAAGKSNVKFPLDYTAASVDLIWPIKRNVDYAFQVREYLASVDEGGDALYSLLTQRATRCGGETFVLVGYSQGSMAIRHALRKMTQKGEGDILSRIGGIGLIADPSKRPNEPNVGDADAKASGVATFMRSPILISSKVSGYAVNACNTRDVVCDFSKNRSDSVHGQYRSTSALDSLTDSLMRKIMRKAS